MIKIERTLTIHRPVQEVFAYLCDVEHGPSYVSGQREAHQTSTEPMAIGTTFVTSSTLLRRTATFEVAEFEPDRRLVWKSVSGTPTTTTWGFQPSGPSTRITFTHMADGHGFFRLPQSLLQERANARVDHDLAALKELLAITRTPTARGW